ncbi:hypothetical protein [Streptomyces platensis]|uniref:hypothetical protein n=1 Tax=Streptomyces platensis TaxID=58346 RepID=UPI0038642398|nr:hypothetical protein OG962_17715 [Streptomyces platensis]
MSKGFRADTGHMAKAAKEAHGHAERVERHSSNLDSKTRGKLLGKGKFGMIVQKAVRPIIDSMITDMSRAMARGHRSIGHGLDITRKNIDDAEEAIRKEMRRHQGDREAPQLKLGDRLLGEDDLRDKHRERVSEHIDDLRSQGHGPQRHLDPTDDMLKERLGKPAPHVSGGVHQKDDYERPAYLRMAGGHYVQTTEKVDPAHGPDAVARLGSGAHMDAEDPTKRHKCGAFSTAFKAGDDEAFMHAERHARSKVDPNGPDWQPVNFKPEDAWGPGSHHERFRGYYIDPANPMGADGKAPQYKSVDFRGAEIFAAYERQPGGEFRLVTMYPEPDKGVNQ